MTEADEIPMHHHNIPYLDESSDLWSYPPRTRKRRKRVRRMTLTRAVIEARKAGMSSGTVTINGVSLSFGEDHNAKPNGHANETADELRRLI